MSDKNTSFVNFSSTNMSFFSFLPTKEKSSSTGFHFHNAYEICHIIDGDIDYSINGSIIHLSVGDCIVIPPYTMHKVISPDAGNNVFFNFFDSYLQKGYSKIVAEEILSRLDGKDYLIIHDKTGELSRIIDEIYEEAKKIRQGEAYSYLAELLSVFPEKKISADDIVPIPKCVEATIEFINENSSKPITLNHVAEATGYTKNYICGTFKQHFGITANEYLTGIRLKNACYMLAQTKYSEKKISQYCGFNSLSYFIKVFTKNLNETPAAYRKKIEE